MFVRRPAWGLPYVDAFEKENKARHWQESRAGRERHGLVGEGPTQKRYSGWHSINGDAQHALSYSSGGGGGLLALFTEDLHLPSFRKRILPYSGA